MVNLKRLKNVLDYVRKFKFDTESQACVRGSGGDDYRTIQHCLNRYFCDEDLGRCVLKASQREGSIWQPNQL